MKKLLYTTLIVILVGYVVENSYLILYSFDKNSTLEGYSNFGKGLIM
jgi:hypothetical protein